MTVHSPKHLFKNTPIFSAMNKVIIISFFVLFGKVVNAQSKKENISALLQDLQKFIQIDDVNKVKEQLGKEFIPSSITEMLPLISETNKRNILLFGVEDELFLHSQYTKLTNSLEKTTVKDKDVKEMLQILLQFYKTNNAIELRWLNSVQNDKRTTSESSTLELNKLISLLKSHQKSFNEKEISQWNHIINQMNDVQKLRGESLATKISLQLDKNLLSEASASCDDWSRSMIRDFSSDSFIYLRKSFLNSLQEVQFIKYHIWVSTVQAQLKKFEDSYLQTANIQAKSKTFGSKIGKIETNIEEKSNATEIPEWQKGVDDLEKFEKMKNEMSELNKDFNGWISLLQQAQDQLSVNSKKYSELSYQGIGIINDIIATEELRKQYWKNKSSIHNKEKTTQWLNYLTEKAVETEQYKQLSDNKAFTQNLIIVISVAVAILLAVIIYILIQKNRSILQTQEELRYSNEENKIITDRILEALNIAKRVQQSLVFPKDAELKAILPGAEILMQSPYQSVTGDFYWAKEISPNQKLFCLVDCESHGSPAALGTVAIKQILDKLGESNIIIKKPNQFVESFINSQKELPNFNELENDDEYSHKYSSMRMAQACFLWIDETNRELTYISDHTDMYILKNDGNIIELKRTMNPATNTVVNATAHLDTKDILFLFSDGIKDRVVSIENKNKGILEEKRLGTRRLKEILHNINDIRNQHEVVDLSDLFHNELNRYEYIEKVDDETAIFISLN